MANILEQIANLLSVKSIVTIILTVVFAMLAMEQQLSQEFLTIYTVIISFYFGTQFEKKNNLISQKTATETEIKEVAQQIDSVNMCNDDNQII